MNTTRRRAEVLQYDDNLQIERRIADEIMETVNRLQLPLILDQLTEGRGNCFPIAILQQCRRPEINQQLKPVPKMLLRTLRTGPRHKALRYSVMNFIKTSEHPRIHQFKLQYEETDGAANKETWDDYWKRMLRDGTWVDYWFVQATAWYLELDIWIVATSNTENSPYIGISGNLENENIPCNGPTITLGTKSNSHYQSLLPIEMFHLEFQNNHQQPDEPRDMFNKMSKSYEESAAQETEKSHVPKVQTKKGMHSEESEPCNSQTLPENKTHETNNDKLHRTSSCVSKEGHKDLSENSLDDTETTQPKSLEPNKTGLQDEVPKSNEDMSGQHDDISASSVKERKDTNGYDPFIYTNNEKKLIFKRTSYDYKLICPNCLKETKQMIQHICKGNCKIVVKLMKAK